MNTWDGKSGGSVSNKLDGVYAKATKDGIVSKSGKPLDLPHISNRLKRHFRKNPDSALEGEVYKKGEGIEAIAGAVKSGGDSARHLKLHVFPKDGEKRPLPFGAVRHVSAKPAKDAAEVQRIFQKAVKRGHEGVVIRDAAGTATKLKPHQDAEWEVAKVHGGPRGVLSLKHGDGTFKVQSKPGLATRPGDRVQVHYSGTSKKGVPKAAVATRVRNSNDFEIMNAHHATPARLLLGDAFPFPVSRPYARVIDLARGESTEEEIARDRATLKKIGIGSAAAGLGLATVIHKGRKAGAVVPVIVKKAAAPSYWAKKRPRVKVRLSTPASRMGLMGPIGLISFQENRDTLSKVRDASIIAGTGAVGAGALVTAHQARKLRKTVREIRENVTPKAVAHEGLKMVKKKAKEKAVEYFPTFTRAAKALKKTVFSTPAQRIIGPIGPIGLIELATATAPYDKSKVRDTDKRFVDHWKVASGMQKGYHPDGSEAKVGMADPAVLKSLYRKASTVNKWGSRGGALVKDAAHVVAGKPRARDASGRKKKREWEKGWAKDAVKKAAIIGGGIGYGIAYKKSPRLRAAQHEVTGAVKRTGEGIKDAISNLSTPAQRMGIMGPMGLVGPIYFEKKKDHSAAVKTGIAGAAIGSANGGVMGAISAAGSKQADDYFGMLKKREIHPSHGGLIVMDKAKSAPFKSKGKFGAGERLARAEHNSLQNLKKTVRKRAIVGGLAGAAVLGGAGYLAASRQKPETRKKRFSTPASAVLVEMTAGYEDKNHYAVDSEGNVMAIPQGKKGVKAHLARNAGGYSGAAIGTAAGLVARARGNKKLLPVAMLVGDRVGAAVDRHRARAQASKVIAQDAGKTFSTPASRLIDFGVLADAGKDAGDWLLKKARTKAGKAALALTGGIAIADAATDAADPEKGKTRWQSAKKGLAKGALYGGVLAGAEPAIHALLESRFSTPAQRMGVIQFDDVAADAGWDIRDPRGKSARVFAPGARKRMRREKMWHEEVDNERKLWKGGVVAAGLAGGAAGIAIGKHLPKPPPGKAGLVVDLLKKRRKL